MPCSTNDPHGVLVICGTCGEVKGPLPAEWEKAHQLCSCAPAEQRKAQPKYGRDFACWVELCYCCGLYTVNSGSRWSSFHCREYCSGHAREVNDRAGYCLVPLGRHSLMNGTALSEPYRRTKAEMDAFAGQLRSLFSRIEQHKEWARATVLTNLARLGFERGDDVPLDSYLARARQLSPEYAFRALVSSLLGPAAGGLLLE